jgi:hypothetical protein
MLATSRNALQAGFDFRTMQAVLKYPTEKRGKKDAK